LAVATASASSVTAGSTVTLDGSGSSVPGGRSITGYQWTLDSGAGIAAFSGATNAATARLATTGAGTVTARLTITDSTGQQASSTVSVTVNLPAAPTVNILAANTVVPAGSSVSFDGSGSAAATGGSIASYRWAVTSNTALASITAGSTAAIATVGTAGNGSGVFTVTLTVTDSFGQQASASSTVTVTAVQPTAAIASAASTLDIGASLVLDGSGSTAPSGRSIASYQWALTSGSGFAAFSGVTTGSTATLTGSAAGAVVVQLTVTDSAGAQGTRSLSLQVAPAAVSGGGGTGATGGGASTGGGGGALSGGWLLALAGAVAALARAGQGRGRAQGN
jgi:serine protease